MSKFFLVLITSLLPVSFSVVAQNTLLTGIVFNAVDGKPIEGVTISCSFEHTKSDTIGSFSIRVAANTHELLFTHPLFDTLRVSKEKSLSQSYYLSPRRNTLKEILITDRRSRSAFYKPGPLVTGLSKKEIEKMPGFLGQNDALKALQTLPGAGKGGDGNSGLYIRGGTSGQNLTVFNDAVIYNPSHLLGFFSVFNSSSVDQIKLYKSGIPAEFGGRLSSIIEVNSSKKIEDSLHLEGGFSALSANLALVAPIAKNLSMFAGARKTFMNTTLWPVLDKLNAGSSMFSKMRYDFFDVNLGINARLSPKDLISLSAYYGGDNFGFRIGRFEIQNAMDWYNGAISASWKRGISNALSLHSAFSSSSYNFRFGMDQDKYQADITSRIRDYNLKSYLTFNLRSNLIKAGIQFSDHLFKPNTPFVNSAGTILDFGKANTYYSDGSSAFISDEVRFSRKFSGYGGVRFTHYRHLGPYAPNNEEGKSIQYVKKNETVSSFSFVEPSVSLQYELSANSSLKLIVSANTQPVHLISVTAVNFPADFWMPSIKGLPPQKGYQGSIGYFRTLKHNQYECYADLYYKSMTGLTEFSGGIMNLIDNLRIEENLKFGRGKAYGAEFFLKKKMGVLTGWIGYTLGRSERQFESINNGRFFAAKYDRRHDGTLVLMYSINKKWDFSASLTYATGNSYTRPISRYLVSGNIVNEYGSYNGSRLPPYHRADLGAVFKVSSSKKWDSSLIFSVYNIYNRKNPIYMFFMAEGDLSKYQVSVQQKSVWLLPVLPSLSYKMMIK